MFNSSLKKERSFQLPETPLITDHQKVKEQSQFHNNT